MRTSVIEYSSISPTMERSCWPTRTKSSASSRKTSTLQNESAWMRVDAFGKSLGDFHPW